MAGMVGEFGSNRRVAFEPAAEMMARRGQISTFIDRPQFRLLFVGSPQTGLHAAKNTIAAICGSPHTATGEKLTAHRLVLEYERTGTIEPARIRGHFSLVLADLRKQTVVLCRDALAVTPLHTIDMGQDVVFSTEYKAILDASGHDRGLDFAAIDYFLRTGWTPAGRTFFSAVKPLAPGQVSLFSVGGVRARVDVPHWRLPAGVGRPMETSQLSNALERSVQRFLEIGGPNIGVMLSGGIDSALIAALLRRARPQQDICALTVGYGQTDPEILGARSTAAALGLEHLELIVAIEELEDLVPASIWAMENVGGHDEYPCLFGLARRSCGQVDAIFSGNLSDTLFAGMASHRRFLTGAGQQARPLGVRGAILYETEFDPIPAQPKSYTLSEELFSALRSRDERMSAQEIFASYAGSEFMMPYGDRDVIDIALRTPDDQKLNPIRNKVILREVASRILPSEIANRPKSIQQLPYDGSMRAFLLSKLEKVAASENGASTVIRADYISQAASALRFRCDRSRVHDAWNIMAFDYWCQTFLSRPVLAAKASAW
ncbi:asparagine synthase-related protein [Pelagibacterium sp. H642]|uniref:asparagine synthetase B family protein n=1 Tax=Pelagibacterium sp. H642 TaxID=1881069 RepID=UPI002816369D|nr:asparagine synthase-related protein [Pelagibacterium sp. H642]WMT92547.1 asparagine synthase-related protein [Pelagibacterium sp. H642]